jgi:hypothetical protein
MTQFNRIAQFGILTSIIAGAVMSSGCMSFDNYISKINVNGTIQRNGTPIKGGNATLTFVYNSNGDTQQANFNSDVTLSGKFFVSTPVFNALKDDFTPLDLTAQGTDSEGNAFIAVADVSSIPKANDQSDVRTYNGVVLNVIPASAWEDHQAKVRALGTLDKLLHRGKSFMKSAVSELHTSGRSDAIATEVRPSSGNAGSALIQKDRDI